MEHGDLAYLGAVIGAAGSALALLLRHKLLLLLAMAALAAAEILIAFALVPSEDLERLQRPIGAAALAVGLSAVAALAVLFARRPALVTPALLVAAPFRVPISLGDQDAFLLVPLYATVAAALGYLYLWLRGEPARAIPLFVGLPTAAFVAFYACSLLWSDDVRQGGVHLVFFLFPFVAAVAVVARAPLPDWLARVLATVAVALATIFAGIGIWQAATHTLFFAQDLRVANAYTSFFRVTSLFKDPSLYGRYLVLGFAVILVGLWLDRVSIALAAVVTAVLFAGLWVSYSQSSMATLVAVVLAVALVAGDRTARRVVAGTAAVVSLLAGVAVTVYAADHSSNRVTSGRTRLVSSTVRVIESNPVIGVGVGAQPKASRDEADRGGRASREASHTTPLTVAAELGIVGAALYLALLAAVARALWETWCRDAALGLGLGAVFFGIFVHSLFYAGFFEDPVVWGCIAVGAAVVGAVPRPAPVETEDRDRRRVPRPLVRAARAEPRGSGADARGYETRRFRRS